MNWSVPRETSDLRVFLAREVLAVSLKGGLRRMELLLLSQALDWLLLSRHSTMMGCRGIKSGWYVLSFLGIRCLIKFCSAVCYCIIKRIIIVHSQAEVDFLGNLQHPHLVKLVGYCIEDDQRLLVYEFMPRGSLENHLFRSKYLLIWPPLLVLFRYIFATVIYLSLTPFFG